MLAAAWAMMMAVVRALGMFRGYRAKSEMM
jgi:hypothetical protein